MIDLNAVAPKLAEVTFGRRRISIARFFDSTEAPNMDQASVDANASLVWVGVREVLYFNPFDPRFIVVIPAFVSQVLRACCKPQIFKTIIGPVSVSMVKLVRWVFTRDHFLNDAMSTIEAFVYLHHDMAGAARGSCAFAAPCAVPSHVFAVCGEMRARAPAPRQRAGIWIIRKALVKVFGIWQRSPSHRSLLDRDWWLEAARSTSSSRLAHSSIGVR